VKSINVVNRDTNLNFTLSNSIIRDTQGQTNSAGSGTGEDGFQFQSYSDAAGAPIVNVDVSNNQFLRIRTQSVQIFSGNDSVMSVDIVGNTIDALASVAVIDPALHIGTGIDLNTNNTARMEFNINGNPIIRSRGGSAVNITGFVDSAIEGRVNNNPNISANGSGAGGTGVRVLAQEGTTTGIVEVKNNTITMGAGNNSSAIDAQARFGSARLDLTLDNNTTDSETTAVADINITAGSSQQAVNPPDTRIYPEHNKVYVDLKNNKVLAGGPTNILRLRVSDLDATSTVAMFLTGFVEGGAGIEDDAVATWNARSNTPAATTANIAVSLTAAAPQLSAGTAQVPDNPQPLFFAVSGPGVEDASEADLSSGIDLLPAGVRLTSEAHPTASELPLTGAAPLPVNTSPESDGRTQTQPIVRAITQSDLDAVAADAVEHWEATGLTESQRAILRGLKFEVADLPAGNSARRIATASALMRTPVATAGSPTLLQTMRRCVDTQCPPLAAVAMRLPIRGRIDLLTAVMHEIGHALGLEDSYAEEDRDSIMYGFLTKGERRFPSQGPGRGR
jgi:hypothetical protein